MNRDEIKSIVKSYILQQFLPGESPDSLDDETKLFTGGIIDSLGSLKLVSFLDDRFGVSFEAHEVDVDHLDTLNIISNVILSKLS